MPYAPRHLPTEGQGNTENWEQLVSFRFKGTALEGGLEEPSLVKEAGVGAWTNVEAISAKIEETTTLQVRTESNKAVARLKGVVKAKEEIPEKTTIFTLPAAFRPITYSHLLAGIDAAGIALLVRIETAGTVLMETKIPAARFFSFDPITYSLT